MALGVTVGVTLAQELPSPGGSKPLPQPQGMGPVVSDDPLDLQARQLEARREKLAYTAQEIDQQMRQSALEQEQRRRRLQQDLNETQEQLREVDRQLADLPRQRRRAQYLAALQALEQASGTRRQAEHAAEVARLAEQDAAAAVAGLRPLPGAGPAIPAETARGLQPSRPTENCIDLDHLEWAQPSVRPEQQLPPNLHALQERVRAVEQQVRAGREAPQKQRRTETQGSDVGQQLEGLRSQMRCTQEHVRVLAAQDSARPEPIPPEISALPVAVQQLGQTLDRIERNLLRTQYCVQGDVRQLHGRLEQTQQQLYQTQGALQTVLRRDDASVVGSAGLCGVSAHVSY